ncbi:MAG: class I SAM-dependent rRNA methyltransferase [Nitrospirota bacterium]
MDKVFLKRTSRILGGHLWIFSNELLTSPKKFEPGSLVEVYDKEKKFLGIGYINPHSLISIRLLTREKENIDSDFFRSRIVAALNYRKRFLLSDNAFRVVYSEGDFLPGLIIDKYADCAVVQFLTFGMEKFAETILSLIDDILSPKTIVLRNDSQSRTLEALPLGKKVVKGSLETLPLINEKDLIFEVDPMSGQKTGFFLDQRENRLALRKHIKEGRGLDLFCYAGAWGMHLAKNGAYVTGVDDSEKALAYAKINARLNNLEDRFGFERGNVFDFLKKEVTSGNDYDFIVLDPPAFVKSRTKVKEALKGYKEINTMAMRILKDGGILSTSSCSYHVDKEVFLEMLRNAAKDAKKNIRLLEYRSQSRDHPVLLSMPETEYLKCAFLAL